MAEEFGRVSTMGGAWYMRRAGGGFLPIIDFSGARMLIPVHWPQEMKLEAKEMLSGQPEMSQSTG